MKSGVRTLYWILIGALISCKPVSRKVESPPGYDFSAPVKFALPIRLDEISGISFYANDIYAIQDELGRLYHFKLDSDKITSAKFGSKADYEDLAILDNTVFILESNGTIFSFDLALADSEQVYDLKEWHAMETACEYEGLFADSATNKIYALSKECIDDASSAPWSGTVFKWKNDSLKMLEHFSIDMQELKKLNGNKKLQFKPSALALHPIARQWFIISSSNQLLLITDEKFTPIQIIKLKESLFSQPEGICFDPYGNLYIANEKGNAFEGMILKFEMKVK